MRRLDKTYYQKLHRKIKQYGYTVMSVVSDEPRNEDHAAYCYTIGLSNYGFAEIMFADCFYDDVIVAADMIFECVKNGHRPNIGQIILTENGRFKLTSLLPGIKEEISEQALFYFELFRKRETNYDLVYLAKEDEWGLFPDEKVFAKSKHINQRFFEQSVSTTKPLVLALPEVIN
jgi:hypothetical protein